MEADKVVLTENELKAFDLSDPGIVELIHHAQESDAADRLLTVREALKKYKKAVFWAMFLSTSLIMEGYDLVIVRSISHSISFPCIGQHVRNSHTDIVSLDHFLLWPNAISNAIWGV